MAKEPDKKVDPGNRPTTTTASRTSSTPLPTRPIPTAPAATRAPTRGKRAADRGPVAVQATRSAEDDRNVATGGYVELTVPKEYGTLEGEQPDGTKKTFKTGERAILPVKQARTLGLIDEDGDLADLEETRAPRTQSYGQSNEPIEAEPGGEGKPAKSRQDDEDEGFEAVGKSPP